MTKMNWVSIVSVGLVVLGNVAAVLMGLETISTATPVVLLALGVIGIHPVLK